MDVNTVNNFQTPTPSPIQSTPTQAPGNGLSTTALILGICSIVFICCGGGIVLGSLGLIFALLSRGANAMNSTAKVGLGLSIGALVLSLVIVPIMIATYLSAFIASDEFKNQFNQELNRYYGDTYNDIYDDIYKNFDRDYEGLFDQYEGEVPEDL